MKKSKSWLWLVLTVVFVAVVYSALLFLSKKNMDLSAWLIYGFTIAAFLFLALQLALPGGSSAVVMDPITRIVTLIYFGVQFLLGGIVCMCFSGLPLGPVVICEAVLLAAYVIVTFVLFSAQSHTAAQDYNDRTAVNRIRLWENAIRGMADQQKDAALKKSLLGLAEAFHFGDVCTHAGLADVESRIDQSIALLREDLTNEEADPAARIEELHVLIKERDRTAAILK